MLADKNQFMNEEKSFLGRGWAFPPEFDHQSLNVRMISNETDIENSLHLLLSTPIGERLLQPEYGCNLDILLFEPLSTGLKTQVKDKVFTAIYYYEPRVEPLDVTLIASETEGLINIYVEYAIRITNTRHNIVYPFYLNEGTNI
jgi:uncharacterized protein